MGTFGYSIGITVGSGRDGEDSIGVRAGVRRGIAIGLGGGVGIVQGVAITGEQSTLSHCSKHSHLTAEVGATAASDDDACEPEDGLIVAVGVAVTIWEGGIRGGAIACSPMLFEAYKFECEDTTDAMTRRIKRMTDIPLTNRFFPGLVSVCPRKMLLRSIINRCS